QPLPPTPTFLSCFFLLPPPPRPTLFPYTTLFRSAGHARDPRRRPARGAARHRPALPDLLGGVRRGPCPARRPHACPHLTSVPKRSEEHTSELQSLAYLVCRLLLEKKKNPNLNQCH